MGEMFDAIRVLYVEDDERLARLTMQYFAAHQIEAHHFSDGVSALEAFKQLMPHVVVLDLMLPGIDGIEVCRRIRERFDVPIIMLTARTEEADRVMGLELGADDYVSKPFSARELVARIRAQARRAAGQQGGRPTLLTVGSLTIDTEAMRVSLKDAPLQLTTYEFELLRVLAERSGRVLSREQLLELTHDSSADAFDRSIDVLISRLRAKLGDNPRSPERLKTVRGRGYMLCDDTTGSK